MKIHHINCGYLQREGRPRILCHCLLLESPDGDLALVDTGIGLQDIAAPIERVGPIAIEMAGFQFEPENTAVHQLIRKGLDPSRVNHCLISHLDPDHIGGLADFPKAAVYVSAREYEDFLSGHPRYPTTAAQLAHGPAIIAYADFGSRWLGLPAHRIDIGFGADIYQIPLPGHTLGHCGYAIRETTGWTFYIGDACYLLAELTGEEHPISGLARNMAMDDALRVQSVTQLRRMVQEYGDTVKIYTYHDAANFPGDLNG